MPNSTKKLNKVMLIDDSEIDLKINSKVISISNLFQDIILCTSGEAGLNYLKKHSQEPDELPDFILLDIQMPGMNGFDFLELYKKLPPKLKEQCPVAILSSTLDFGDIKRAEANPYVVRMLKKPLNLAELKEVINAL